MKALQNLRGRGSGDISRARRLAALAQTTVAIRPIAAAAATRPGHTHEPASALSGRLVAGRYRLRSLLGRGGMGRVWLAEDELLRRAVALKQHLPGDAGSEEENEAAHARALNEAQAAARVDHDGAVKIHDLVRDGSLTWIVMELLSGRTLAQTLAADGPLSASRATELALGLLEVLTAVHDAGVVHRDVKPGNVHLCADGRVVLTDFGIASIAGDEPGRPPDVSAGSPAYISPEQLRGDDPAPASDLFSLGATLFATVEGKGPFDKGDMLATLVAVAEDAPSPSLRAGRLRPVIRGLLAKDPERRLTAGQAYQALLAGAADREGRGQMMRRASWG